MASGPTDYSQIEDIKALKAEIERLRVERDAQIERLCQGLIDRGIFLAPSGKALKAEIERLRVERDAIFLAPSGYWWAWSNVKADRCWSLRTKDKAKAQAMYDRMLEGQKE